MAKKRKIKDLKKEEEMENDDSLSFKHWLTRAAVMAFILFTIVYMVERYLKQPMLVDALIAVSIVLMIGFAHEALHYYRTVKLGYKPVWYRTKLRMGFTINHQNKGTWARDKKKIAIIPYVFLIPLSLVLLIGGFYINHIGICVAGLGSLLLHSISWPAEGKDA